VVGFCACVQETTGQKHRDREEGKPMLLVAFQSLHRAVQVDWHRIYCRCDVGLLVGKSVWESRYLSDIISARE
jgi:hypothetical protein